MKIHLLIKGLLIGLSIAAPVGAIGLLCINRTLSQGSLVGFVSGLGAATADSIYGCIAGFGLNFISDFLIQQQFWLQIVGGLFLCYLGVKTFTAKPKEQEFELSNNSLLNAYISTLSLTITNPTTILSFIAVFASLGLANTTTNHSSAAVLVLGVFLGSACWWLILSSSVGLIRRKFNSLALKRLNQASDLIIAAFGVIAIF
ncbi:MAG: LysE family transporter [Cyanobacteria bacterium P01_A01_bin.40]